MNREIKYRAWIKNKKYLKYTGGKQMIQVDFIQCSPYLRIDVNTVDNNEKWIDVENNAILLQFTGLLDRSGKEIYEGDIIRDFENQITTVEWTDFGWKPWIDIINMLFAGYPSFSEPETFVEIIGNIYENGELLK